MAKKKYWNEQQDQLVLDINSSSGSTQERFISELYPVLTTMGEAILNRYFRGSFNGWEFDIIVLEAIQKVFVQLHYFDPNRAKAFSFCQTVIRNHYTTKLVRPSEKEQRWRDTVNEDPNIIDPDHQTKYGYVDQNIEREIIPSIDIMLDRLYRIKKDVDESYDTLLGHTQYQRNKKKLPTPKYSYGVDNLKKIIHAMINILEEKPDIEYERFVIEVYIRSKTPIASIQRATEVFGMDFPKIHTIISGYSGALEHKYEQRNTNQHVGCLEVVEHDYTPSIIQSRNLSQRRTYKRKKKV